MSKKVLLFSNSARSLVDFRGHLMRDLIGRGYEVVACSPASDKDLDYARKTLSEIGVRYVKIKLNNVGLNPFYDLFSFFRLLRLIRNEAPSIVLNYRIKLVIYSSLAARCAKVPNIFSTITGLGYVFVGNDFRARFIRFLAKNLYKLSLKFNKKVFFQNPDDLNLFVNDGLLPKDKAVLVNGSGVDIREYSPASFPQAGTFFLGTRLIKDKGVYEYIGAARKLKERYPAVRFLLAGDLHPNPSSLTREELDSLVSEGVVEYLGWVDDVNKALAMVSVFVLPSYREGTPRATLEAMAMGRPIITTDVPGCRETVIDGVNGYLVPVKSVESLADAMEKFILHPELMAKMGKESRRVAEEKYDVDKVNRVILAAMDLS